MQSKRFWMAALAATAVVISGAVPARDLTVVSWGGAYQDAQRDVYFKPFMEKTKIKMAEENWDGGVGTLRAKIQGGSNNWDVVQVESDELLLGCEEGLYEKLDWTKLGGRDKYMPDAVATTVDLVSQGRLSVDHLLTHRLGWQDVGRAYEMYSGKLDNSLKIVMKA